MSSRQDISQERIHFERRSLARTFPGKERLSLNRVQRQHSRNRPWHESSEEPHEIRQLPHIDIQSPDFFCIFHYCIFMTFYVTHQIDKVFLVHFRFSSK